MNADSRRWETRSLETSASIRVHRRLIFPSVTSVHSCGEYWPPPILERDGAPAPKAQIPRILEPHVAASPARQTLCESASCQNAANCGMENRFFRARSIIPKLQNTAAIAAPCQRLSFVIRHSKFVISPQSPAPFIIHRSSFSRSHSPPQRPRPAKSGLASPPLFAAK